MLNEKLSAWCDGETGRPEENSAYPSSADERAECELAWLIGDVLRDEPALLSAEFTAQVMAVLQSEPVVFAPRSATERLRSLAANHWMAMAAALSGVLVAGWMTVSVWSGSGDVTVAKNAVVPSPLEVAEISTSKIPVGVQSLDSDQAYLMAHQAASNGAPMADVVHYIRTVSDEQGVGK